MSFTIHDGTADPSLLVWSVMIRSIIFIWLFTLQFTTILAHTLVMPLASVAGTQSHMLAVTTCQCLAIKRTTVVPTSLRDADLLVRLTTIHSTIEHTNLRLRSATVST